MKKKLSLIVRHRPTRKKQNRSPRSPLKNKEEEPCSSAKQYLFSLNEQQQNCQNYSRLMLFESHRNHQDHSISQWDSKESQDWAYPQGNQNGLNASVCLKKTYFRVKTEHKDDGMLTNKLGQEIQKKPFILSPKKLPTKILRREGRPQNLSQLEIVAPPGPQTPQQQLSTISNKSQCIKTIKLLVRDQKERIKMHTEVLPVSYFKYDLDKSPYKIDKLEISGNHLERTTQGLGKTSGDTLCTFDRLKTAQKKKKFDIFFVRHKLRRREGMYWERQKQVKSFFEVDGHSWISQNKLK